MLKPELVAELLALLGRGKSVNRLALAYGVDRKTVRAWRPLPWPLALPRGSGVRHGHVGPLVQLQAVPRTARLPFPRRVRGAVQLRGEDGTDATRRLKTQFTESLEDSARSSVNRRRCERT